MRTTITPADLLALIPDASRENPVPCRLCRAETYSPASICRAHPEAREEAARAVRAATPERRRDLIAAIVSGA